MNCTLWTGSWIIRSVVGSTHSSVQREENVGRDSEHDGEQDSRAGQGAWDRHKGPREMGKMSLRRLGSGTGCWCIFWLGICQVIGRI